MCTNPLKTPGKKKKTNKKTYNKCRREAKHKGDDCSVSAHIHAVHSCLLKTDKKHKFSTKSNVYSIELVGTNDMHVSISQCVE